MEKVNVVLVALNREFLESALNNLDFDKVNLGTIFMDGGDETFQFGDKEIPVNSFALIHKQMKLYKEFVWLICGYVNDVDDVYKMKRFLMTFDISEDNIVNFEMSSKISPTWLANLRYIEKNGADFFATGNEYTQNNLNMNFIPRVNANKKLAKGGVNLADVNQNLWQSYLTAKNVFEHVAPGTIKFVLIGLTLNSFRYDNEEFFFDPRKVFSFANAAAQPDLNFDDIKNGNNKAFSIKSAIDLKDAIFLSNVTFQKNIEILKNYIELCLANGAKPIGVIFPVAPALRKIYNPALLNYFRDAIRQLEKNYDFTCIDMFELNLNYDCFCSMTHLNLTGSLFTNSFLAFKLYKKNLIPLEGFYEMNYDYLDNMLRLLNKDETNELMGRIFDMSVQKIRRKDKIKVGFVLYDSSMWCGDDLYNFFAADKRFEPTVFLSLRMDKANRELTRKDFLHGVEQFKSHGLNVVALSDINDFVPEQDVLITLTSFFLRFPNALHTENLTPKTLLVHMPYSFTVSSHRKGFYSKRPIFNINWKIFFSSFFTLNLYSKNNICGMPRAFFSGYPKLDVFFEKNAKLEFEWKMAHPNAKKIIWAPHHSIRGTSNVKYATFQWNYQFMYDFAKAHPETSWVVKPHPNLLFTAVSQKIFPSIEAFKKYLQKWDDLPNAQVYTGAYYQAIFATSDGMIHDSGSFIAEYQYVDKPMIYLTCDTQNFNDLGNEILKVSYLVDGKDLKGIAALMQKVFIEGNDDKAIARRRLFDRYLNYPKTNGMLASEFIYKSIADEFKEGT